MFLIVSFFAGPLIRGSRIAWDAQVIELTSVCIDVKCKLAIASFQFSRATTCGVGTAVPQFTGTVYSVDGFNRNAVVEDTSAALRTVLGQLNEA